MITFGWLRTCPNAGLDRQAPQVLGGRVRSGCCTTKRRDAQANLFLSSPAFLLHCLQHYYPTSNFLSILVPRSSQNLLTGANFITSIIKRRIQDRLVWVALGPHISRCVLQTSSLRFSSLSHPWLRLSKRALNHRLLHRQDVRQQ